MPSSTESHRPTYHNPSPICIDLRFATTNHPTNHQASWRRRITEIEGGTRDDPSREGSKAKEAKTARIHKKKRIRRMAIWSEILEAERPRMESNTSENTSSAKRMRLKQETKKKDPLSVAFLEALRNYNVRDHTGQKAGLHDPALAETLLRASNALIRGSSTIQRHHEYPVSSPENQEFGPTGTKTFKWSGVFCLSRLDRRKPALVMKGSWKHFLEMKARDEFMPGYIRRHPEYEAEDSMFHIDQLQLLADAIKTGTQTHPISLPEAREGYKMWKYHYSRHGKSKQELDEEDAKVAAEVKKQAKMILQESREPTPKVLAGLMKTHRRWKAGKTAKVRQGQEVDAIMKENSSLSVKDACRLYYQRNAKAAKLVAKLNQLYSDKQLAAELGLKPSERTRRADSVHKLSGKITNAARMRKANIAAVKVKRKPRSEKKRGSL